LWLLAPEGVIQGRSAGPLTVALPGPLLPAESATKIPASRRVSHCCASMPFQVYYYVELDGRAITPVVDFSGLEEMDSYGDVAEGSDLPWRAYSPWTGSLTSAGDKLLMVNDLAGETAVLVAPLPPTGALPAVAASAETISSGGSPTASRGEGGKVLVYGNLLTITEP